MLVYQKTTGFRAAEPALKFLFENNSFGIFFSARACKLFSLFAICGEAMRERAEPLSAVMKNLFGDSARKNSGEYLDVGRSYLRSVIVQESSMEKVLRIPRPNSGRGRDG